MHLYHTRIIASLGVGMVLASGLVVNAVDRGFGAEGAVGPVLALLIALASIPVARGLSARFSRELFHDTAEVKLRESEARFRAIIDNAADAIITFDPGSRIVGFNPAAATVFELQQSEALGRSVADLIMPPQLSSSFSDSGWRGTIDHLDGQTRGRRFETEAMRADGTLFPIELAITAVPLGGREVFTAFLRDITDRRQAEAELAAYREQLEDLVAERTIALVAAEGRLVTAINTLKGGFALYDADERLIIVNETMSDFLPEAAHCLTPGALLEEVTRTIAAANGFDDVWTMERLNLYRAEEEFTAQRQLSNERWIETSVRHTPDGSTLFVLTDISAHKDAEKTLTQALAKEKELGLLQREFVSMTSHEFRTPLAIIDASVQRLMRRHKLLSDEDFTMLGQEIRAAVTRMVGLMDAILHTARLDSGTIAFNPGPCDLRQVIKDACKRQQALAPGRTIITTVDRLPDTIMADTGLLDQVANNLVNNAVKYSPDGGQIIVTGWTENNDVVFTVTDSGIGVPAAELPRLFERFFRASSSTGIAGTGIGLYIVKRFLDLHQAVIDVESTEGRGTTFTVRLPLQH